MAAVQLPEPPPRWAVCNHGNVRLFELPGDVLRYNNRVHETLEDSLQQLAAQGVHPQVRSAPFVVEHYGLAGGDDHTRAKLHFTRLLALQVLFARPPARARG